MKTRYRVWPDYTVQEAWEPPYEFMSDDYMVVMEESEEAANERQTQNNV